MALLNQKDLIRLLIKRAKSNERQVECQTVELSRKINAIQWKRKGVLRVVTL